jgi:hypothetical protein
MKYVRHHVYYTGITKERETVLGNIYTRSQYKTDKGKHMKEAQE